MALVMFDGFEILPNLRNNGTPSGTVSSNAGRTGGKALGIQASQQVSYALGTPISAAILGFAFKESGASWGATTAGSFLAQFYSDAGATVQLTVNISNDGHLLVRRGAATGTIIATASAPIAAGVWHYLEIQVSISDTVGYAIVRCDGVELINVNGQDTRNGGTLTTVSTVNLGSFGGCLYDDLYLCDVTGLTYNSFLGDRVVRAGRPDGAGATTGLTPSAGSNYQCVDEDPWTTTDYVSGTTGTDTYTVADVSGFASVDAVQAVAYASKTDAGARTLRTVMRSNLGTQVESSDLPLTTTVSVVQGPIRQVDPDSAPLTQTLVNTAQYGVKVV